MNEQLKGINFATSYWKRLRGFMFRCDIKEDELLLFPKCQSIHTFFMWVPIDVLYLNDEGKVVHIYHSLKPWRLTLPKNQVKHVLEMQAGRATTLGIQEGDTILERRQLS